MGRVSPFTLLENTFSYTSKERVGKQIPSKDIPSGTGEPLKETKNIIEDENHKEVRMSTEEPLINEEMIRYQKGKQVCTYTDVVYDLFQPKTSIFSTRALI